VTVHEAVVAWLLDVTLRLGGLAVLAGGVAAGAALAHRWYTRERAPRGVGVLLALAAVALYLNVKTALGDVVAGELALLAPRAVAFNLAALGVGLLAAPVGVRVGDRAATDLVTVAGAEELDAAVGGFARVVGRVDAVTLPAEIETVEGYDPVPAAVAADLAGTTLVFPRGLDADALRERLVSRLKEEEGVGYVDVELSDGVIEYLALGARQSGLGPTLAPGDAAVAVTADPPADASPGDLVQVWEGGRGGEAIDGGTTPERVAAGELRAVHGDAVTLALDAQEAAAVAGGDYRLVTLPGEERPERTFAALLRHADETMGAVTVPPGSALAGVAVGAIDATVAAVKPADGPVEPVPPRRRLIAAGDRLYVVAHPQTLRRLEAAVDSDGPDPAARTGAEAGGDGGPASGSERENGDGEERGRGV
jgi:hypothetical protein